MIEPVWHTGSLDGLARPGDAPLVWRIRLDDPAVRRMAGQAALREADWRDLAQRPQAAMRALRRQLTRVLLAWLADCHPDHITLGRSPAGAPLVLDPPGWHVSVAGRWPHGLIGVSRRPLGVDIEPLSAEPPPEDALTAGERKDLAEAPAWQRLSRWTGKEAHAKALGHAAQADPALIHTRGDGPRLRITSPEGETLCHLRIEGEVMCAVATPCPAAAG